MQSEPKRHHESIEYNIPDLKNRRIRFTSGTWMERTVNRSIIRYDWLSPRTENKGFACDVSKMLQDTLTNDDGGITLQHARKVLERSAIKPWSKRLID